ncbi:DUF2075 domain-containing protein [Rubripirellula sp.]|nr:DUF2075 domain-containing protein [Rubripirellula sp.]
MNRAYYSNSITQFLTESPQSIYGKLALASEFAVEQGQKSAWKAQIDQLKVLLRDINGSIYFEFSIPRMGKRVDVVLLIGQAIFVVEYKVGDSKFASHAVDQVMDYCLDLKNFHATSHDRFIMPVLVATDAENFPAEICLTSNNDRIFNVTKTNGESLVEIVSAVDEFISSIDGESTIETIDWEHGSYCPTPTIIEAAMALYNGHEVAEISRNDASGENLHSTTKAIENVIVDARQNSYKAACFVTGVPGAGKTLIGLNVATQHFDKKNNLHSVFLSGNGPLVKILQEALARDKVEREKSAGRDLKKGVARSEVKMFIQNVHHYRDECLSDPAPPVDRIALFDEAQRAWDLKQTANFMRQKKNRPDFEQSEPEFLLSCIDRHPDWGVVVCLVGGGQEINKGEAGISEWIEALNRTFPDWHIHISDRLTDKEFGAGRVLELITNRENVHFDSRLHLSVSMRSYRAENVSNLVKQILDLDVESARNTLVEIGDRYPIVLTRELEKAKAWLRDRARVSERYGLVVSSQANRLKPLAIDVRLKRDPIHWFLAGKEDVRSSYYLEDVATEFDIQGLELDWVCVTWDADLRLHNDEWLHRCFRGNRWQKINKLDRQSYLKNAYRVLLTRARQGMVIVIPEGDEHDPTRLPSLYDSTYEYFVKLGLPCL